MFKSRDGSNVEIHNKNCPNNNINQCLMEGSLTEKATNTAEIKSKILNTNLHDADDMNDSEDSSNCEDPDEDEGKEMSVISNIRVIIF